LEEPRHHPSRQRMHLPAACATMCNAHCMQTSPVCSADESNHSAVGMLRPHRSATFFLYVTLRCPIQSINQSIKLLFQAAKLIKHTTRPIPKLPFSVGMSTHRKKNHPLAHSPPKRHNWRTYTELLLLLVMYEKLVQTYRISMWTSMHDNTITMLNVAIAYM